jgi:hypothetical protein
MPKLNFGLRSKSAKMSVDPIYAKPILTYLILINCNRVQTYHLIYLVANVRPVEHFCPPILFECLK